MDFFETLPFEYDPIGHFAPSFASTCTSCSASTAICGCMPLTSLTHGVIDEVRSDALKAAEDLEIHHVDRTSLLHTKRFDLQSRLSFWSPSSFDVMSDTPLLEPLFCNDFEQSPHHQLIHTVTRHDSLEGISLHFSKIISAESAKKAEWVDCTEVLFDIRPHGAQTTTSSVASWASLTNLDSDHSVSLTDDLCIPAASQNSSGRSKISKLQHDVLNTWFYSHLDSP